MFHRQPANDCGLLKIKGSLRYCVVEVRRDTRPRVSLPARGRADSA